MPSIIGVGQISLTDLNDAIISGDTPSNPTVGTLWVDTSPTPSLLKRWDGANWIVIGEILDEGTGIIIGDVVETLGNMANDNLLDYQERKVIKDKLTEIIGFVISDTATSLPTTSTLDNSGKGGFYSVRKSALNAGLTTSDTSYIAVATQYNNLKTYLEGLTTVEAWDLRAINKDKTISVTKSTFRDKWLQYYLAVDALSTATAEKLKENVDNIEVGGTNYASNGDFSIPLENGRWNPYLTGGDTKNVIDISTEIPPHQFALNMKNTTVKNAGYFDGLLWSGETANNLIGKNITVSFWLKYSNIVKGANAWNVGRFGTIVIESETSTGSKIFSYLESTSVVGTKSTWEKIESTYKIALPSGAVKITKISLRHGLESCTGEFWTTGIKVELGNKATDWSVNPLDLQGRLTNVELQITPEGIMTKVQSTESWSTVVNTASEAESKASSAVSTANSAKSESSTAVSTANSASTKAGNAESTANSAVSTANSANTKAGNAESKANSAVSTANSASTKAGNAESTANNAISKVENMVIGGANLLRQSNFDDKELYDKFWAFQSGWSVDTINTFNGYNSLVFDGSVNTGSYSATFTKNFIKLSDVGLKAGDKITFSFYFKSTGGLSDMPYVEVAGYENETQTANVMIGRLDLPTGVYSNWVKYELTFEIPATNSNGNVNYIKFLMRHRSASATNSDKFWYALPKLEKGEKSTDWTPSPEDAKDKIANVTGLLKVRYIRDWLNGSTSNTGNHWVEIEAYVGDTNIALGKPVITSAGNDGSRVTNGVIDTVEYYSSGEGLNNVVIDLQEVRDDIDSINVRHYYNDSRTYQDTKTEVSEDGVNWVVLFDSSVDGEYSETPNGNLLTVNENVSRSLRDAGSEIVLIKRQFDEVQQSVTPEGISTLIESSVFYDNYRSEMDGKVNSDVIGGLVSRDEFENYDETVNGKISDAVDGINFEPYATKLDLEETSKNITAKFSATGGMNLIKNSIGFADFDFWSGSTKEPSVQPIKNNELDILGFGSGFQFYEQGSYSRNILQEIPVVVGSTYTLSWYAKKTSNNTVAGEDGRVAVQALDENNASIKSIWYQNVDTTNGYEFNSATFTATTPIIKIRVYCYPYAIFAITGLMLTIGDMPLQWSLATGEVYNTNIRMDVNGIRVSQLDSNRKEIGYTQITPEEFAGYYDSNGDGNFQKVFYLNGEETVTKKFKAIDEITMGSIKIIRVESGGNHGWAFVPITEE
jgi:hypothetical protein